VFIKCEVSVFTSSHIGKACYTRSFTARTISLNKMS